jgi:hypothetical protein
MSAVVVKEALTMTVSAEKTVPAARVEVDWSLDPVTNVISAVVVRFPDVRVKLSAVKNVPALNEEDDRREEPVVTVKAKVSILSPDVVTEPLVV